MKNVVHLAKPETPATYKHWWSTMPRNLFNVIHMKVTLKERNRVLARI